MMRTISRVLALLVLALTLEGCPAQRTPDTSSMAVTHLGPKGLPVHRSVRRPLYARKGLFSGRPASQLCTATSPFNCAIRSRWTGTNPPNCGRGFFPKEMIPAPPLWSCVHVAPDNGARRHPEDIGNVGGWDQGKATKFCPAGKVCSITCDTNREHFCVCIYPGSDPCDRSIDNERREEAIAKKRAPNP